MLSGSLIYVKLVEVYNEGSMVDTPTNGQVDCPPTIVIIEFERHLITSIYIL